MEKTEPPSPRRLARARASGDLPVSPLAARSAALLVLALLGPPACRAALDAFRSALRAALSADPGTTQDPRSLAATVATLALPLLLAITVLSFTLTLAQRGGVIFLTRERGRDGADRGFGALRLLDGARVSRLLLGLLSAGTLLVASWLLLLRLLPGVAHLADAPRTSLTVTGGMLTTLLFLASGIVGSMAVLDWFVRRGAWLRRLRMSRSELVAERRADEGAPELRRARRRAHEELG